MAKQANSHPKHSHSAKSKPDEALAVFDELLAKLASSAYKVTKPRLRLLEVISQAQGPFSADSLFESMSANGEVACDLVTIYRTLPTFEELEIIERCDFADERTSYEVITGDRKHHHHHIVCSKCKKVEALDFCIVETQQRSLEKLGYTELKHKLEFVGICPSCSK